MLPFVDAAGMAVARRVCCPIRRKNIPCVCCNGTGTGAFMYVYGWVFACSVTLVRAQREDTPNPLQKSDVRTF